MLKNYLYHQCKRLGLSDVGNSYITMRQHMSNYCLAVLLVLTFSYFFYHSLVAGILMIPIGVVFVKQRRKQQRIAAENTLRNQFKDAMLGIAANLKAGYAVENAFRETIKEMEMLYGKGSPIYRELYVIVQGLQNGMSIEKQMQLFATRTEIEEIKEFSDVFAIAKRSGGNLTDIIYNSVSVISEKIEVDKEIQVLIQAKRMEWNVMNVIPFAITLYVGAVSKGYFDVLYHTSSGRVVMTVCLIIYIAGYIWGSRIMQINI